ncbi:hypothetical protein P4B35_07790 [Pontiellaceae bacterium B12227]|nr:hypothetical protein [Pontiellaceae bacterium B12227]
MELTGALFLYAAASHATVQTMSVDVNGFRNVLADPGFETLNGNEPSKSTGPWFTSGEREDGQLRVSANRSYTGRQSVVFANYWERGAVVQNLGIQVNPSKHYRFSVMMRLDEPTADTSLTNTPALHATIYTSPAEDGIYTYRKGFFWNMTASPGGGWEKVAGTINGADLSAYSGEYIQVRIIKASEKATHRIFIDNASVTESDSAEAPQTVARYLVGGNVVYSKDEGPDWVEKNKVDVLKRAGLSNLRYPGGHVVSFWDWEFPYHSAYANFWDPAYIASLTESKKAELMAENEHRLLLDQYLDLCRETGAAPVIGINLFQGYRYDRDQDSIDKAVRLVDYVKDQIDGPRYYYLDNEVGHQPTQNNHVPIDDYIPLIPDYSTAIKAADPLGKIVVNIMGRVRVEDIIRDVGDHVDLIDHHWYYNNRTYGQFWLEDWRVDGGRSDRARNLDSFNQWIETYNKPHIKVGLLEWNIGPSEGEEGSTPGNVFYQGLVQADMLMFMIGYNVEMASIWPLTWDSNFRNLIDGPAHNVSPTVHIHRAFSKAAGGTILNLTEPDTGEQLKSLAVKSADEAFIDLYFLNKSTEVIELDLELPVPVVETLVMTFAQGASSNEVNVTEQHYAEDFGVLGVSLDDTSFTHIRCRISDSPTSYELFADDFETAIDAGNVASAPYPVGSWHHQGTEAWQTEGSAASVDIGELNGVAGQELRLGWGYDEVVALYSTPTPIHTSQSYTFCGRWEIGNVVDEPRGFIAGIAEFSADDGSLVQRLTSDSLVFGNTNAPAIGEKGTFEVTLSSAELAAAGTAPGNRIGVFFHHNNGDDQLYGDSNSLRNDVYYIDNVSLEVSGAITLLDQWMVSNKVANALADSDGDGVNNQNEYWFGGNPTIDDAITILPRSGTEGSWFEYVYRRRSDYKIQGLNYTVETTTNLISNDWNSNGIINEGFGSVESETDSVTNRISTDEQPEQFIRLRVR